MLLLSSPASAGVLAMVPGTSGACLRVLSALQPVLEALHAPPAKISDTAPDIPVLPYNELRPEQRKLYEGVDTRWSGWTGEQPSAELKQIWSATTTRSAVACLRTAGPDMVLVIVQETPDAGATVRVSEPVFDRMGRRGLVLIQDIGKGYGGRTALQLLAREGDRWRVIGEHTILIS